MPSTVTRPDDGQRMGSRGRRCSRPLPVLLVVVTVTVAATVAGAGLLRVRGFGLVLILGVSAARVAFVATPSVGAGLLGAVVVPGDGTHTVSMDAVRASRAVVGGV